jgi:AcrR family transcriptional regulator
VGDGENSVRKPRADSLRNRDQLLAAAKMAFADHGADVALEEIARRAGVGIGTLYRHFPNRDAVLAAVYQREVDQLTVQGEALLAAKPAGDALEAWLDLLVDYLDTKKVVVPALRASDGGAQVYAASGGTVMAAYDRLVEAARDAGAIRADISNDDMRRILTGLSTGYDQPGWAPSARRLIGVLLVGLKPLPA